MRKYSIIEATQTRNEYGATDSINYKWIGKSPYTYISWEYIRQIFKPGDEIGKIKIGPYTLLKVEEDHPRGAIVYVRDDRLGALRVALYRSSRWLDLIYRRSIIVLSVWNLAEFHPSRVPSYKDIKAIRAIERMFKNA